MTKLFLLYWWLVGAVFIVGLSSCSSSHRAGSVVRTQGMTTSQKLEFIAENRIQVSGGEFKIGSTPASEEQVIRHMDDLGESRLADILRTKGKKKKIVGSSLVAVGMLLSGGLYSLKTQDGNTYGTIILVGTLFGGADLYQGIRYKGHAIDSFNARLELALRRR